ncbi:unnamed protein product [Rotaria sordida]|uniref:Uncharacterized protein n=1 Tax=Rotaria sordida TaxID=392033 RepID=A0A816A7C0_9BILA|nr:unnamed protein product [Rotaria sordida]CAF1593923.1 unnamed protein product [Rotaria sordida]
MDHAGSLHYNLEKVHGDSVVQTLNMISNNLMIDVQSLSVCLRACAAFHEDEGKVLLANVPQRAKSIGEFTLLITTMGTGKSLIFSKIMEMQHLKREYDLKREKGGVGGVGASKNSSGYRHAVLNEITGPGLTKYLDKAGNVLVLIDEFDGDHQKLGLFGTESKPNNLNSSAASVLKSFHTGIPFYQKAKVSDSGHLKNPQVSFLAASNGVPVMDILRSKLKTSVMPDALVMRTIFDVIDSPPKFNSDYKNKFMPTDAIGLEMFLLASSLLTNQTYIFDTSGSRSADELLQGWQDMCVASGARWKNVDKWTSSRFAKTSELTARLAAQLTHIDLAYTLLREFIHLKQLPNPNGPVSFDTYCQMADFFHARYPPDSSTSITISSSQVEAAIYATKTILLKFFNLFDLTANRSGPILEIPWIPPSSISNSNAAVVQLPSTQGNDTELQIDPPMLNMFQTIIKFPSICFTFSQLVKTFSKLKHQYKNVGPALEKLVKMEILLKFEGGLQSEYEKSSTLSKTNHDLLNISNESSQDLIHSNITNNDDHFVTSTPTQDFAENNVQLEVGQQQEISSIVSPPTTSNSNKFVSSLVFDSTELSSSSQTSIDFLLPRPPSKILRNSNIDDNLEQNDTLEFNTENNHNDSLNSTENNEDTNNSMKQIDQILAADIPQSDRTRTKTKRFYSSERNEDEIHTTKKKKKTVQRNKTT